MKKMKATGKYVAGKGLKQVIMAAKKTWHKAKRGGGEDSDEEEKLVDVDLTKDTTGTTGVEKDDPTVSKEVAGGRRRKTRRRRHSRRR